MSHVNTIYLRTRTGPALIKPEIYPGGELRLPNVPKGEIHEVFARLESANDIMALVLLSEALEYSNRRPPLVLPYIPYGRQDRRSSDAGNQTHSLRAFTNILNGLSFSSVTTHDPHSTVTPALLRQEIVTERQWTAYPIFDILRSEHNGIQPSDIVLVSPDAGALKATEAIAAHQKIDNILICSKVRDMATGRITRLSLMNPNEGLPLEMVIHGKHLVICDDICDGGFTFTQVADAVAPYGPESLNLSVTHGIFSKGLAVLEQYDRVYSAFPFQRTRHLWADPALLGPFSVYEGVGNASMDRNPKVTDELGNRLFSNVYFRKD